MEINEEIKQKMIEYLQSFEAGIKKAGEFSAEQAPLVVQEYLAWTFWGNAIPAAIIFALMLVAVIVVAVVIKKNEDGELKCLAGVIGGFGLLLFAIPLEITAGRALKVSIAPRVVVLEKISELVR